MVVRSTRATKALDALGVDYRAVVYRVSERVGEGYGEAVAAAIGMAPERVFKTLVTEADRVGNVAIIPVSKRLSTKALAQAAGAKRATLASPQVAERLTGYVIGGVSPFGLRRRLAVFIDESALAYPEIAVSGGLRGLQLVIRPSALIAVLEAVPVPLALG